MTPKINRRDVDLGQEHEGRTVRAVGRGVGGLNKQILAISPPHLVPAIPKALPRQSKDCRAIVGRRHQKR